MSYYARNDEEREFDMEIRDTIKKAKSKTHMALYLQGQEELNMLREMLDNQKALEDDIHAVYHLLEKSPVYEEKYDIKFDKDDGYLMLKKEIDRLRMKIDDLLEYICEANENYFDWSDVEDKFSQRMKEDAKSLVRDQSIKCKKAAGSLNSATLRKQSYLWDYILCCLEAE